MTAKVRIKAGPVEFEYEGETELGVTDIKDLFSHIEKLFKAPGLREGGEINSAGDSKDLANQANTTKQGAKLHINSVAQKLNAKSGSEVAIAAAATMQVFDGKETFSRNELLDMMKKATMYYNTNMSSNLTKILGTLVGAKFNQVSDGVYCLTAAEYQRVSTELA